jgi:hypothetical protein
MKQKKTIGQAITPQEIRLIEQLRQHPEIKARVESIMELVRNEDGPLKTADQVEGVLIQELRRLGSTTMHQWANQAEQRVTTELQQQDPTVRSRKKKR